MKKLLIISGHFDYHAAAVQWAVEKVGANVGYLCMPDFTDRQALTAKITNSDMNILAKGVDIDLDMSSVDTTWIRRECRPIISNNVDPVDAKYAMLQAREMVSGMLSQLSRTTFAVNSYEAGKKYSNKLNELMLAKQIGLGFPDTLISNSPEEIRDFYHAKNGKVIFKPLSYTAWLGADRSYSAATTILKPEALENDAALAACPGIFQAHVHKAFELRVNIFGNTVIATKLDSQASTETIDWRFDCLPSPPLIEFELPTKIRTECLRYMREAGLLFGCLDFVVDRDGNYVFLEVNQMGQFLWIENILPNVQLLDVFTQLLLSGDPEFVYVAPNPRIVLKDFNEYYQENRETYDQQQKRHVKLGITNIIMEADRLTSTVRSSTGFL